MLYSRTSSGLPTRKFGSIYSLCCIWLKSLNYLSLFFFISILETSISNSANNIRKIYELYIELWWVFLLDLCHLMSIKFSSVRCSPGFSEGFVRRFCLYFLHFDNIPCAYSVSKSYTFTFWQLVKLPRSPNVDEILTKYLEHRSKKDGMWVSFLIWNFPIGHSCNFLPCLSWSLKYRWATGYLVSVSWQKLTVSVYRWLTIMDHLHLFDGFAWFTWKTMHAKNLRFLLSSGIYSVKVQLGLFII